MYAGVRVCVLGGNSIGMSGVWVCVMGEGGHNTGMVGVRVCVLGEGGNCIGMTGGVRVSGLGAGVRVLRVACAGASGGKIIPNFTSSL